MSKDFLKKYEDRLRTTGESVGDAYKNNTEAFIDANFESSPTFRRLKIESAQFPEITEIDARIVEVERLGTLREAILRPNAFLDIGAYASFDNEDYLIYDRYGGTGATNMKLGLVRCNRTLNWIDKEGTTHRMLCISGATDLGSKAKQSKDEIEFNRMDVSMPMGKLLVFVQLDDVSKTVNLKQRFLFGRNAYEVTGIDDMTGTNAKGFGYVQFTMQITQVHEKDDFVNSIAFNSYKTSDKEADRERDDQPW